MKSPHLCYVRLIHQSFLLALKKKKNLLASFYLWEGCQEIS